jgi:hypothetical protein
MDETPSEGLVLRGYSGGSSGVDCITVHIWWFPEMFQTTVQTLAAEGQYFKGSCV